MHAFLFRSDAHERRRASRTRLTVVRAIRVRLDTPREAYYIRLNNSITVQIQNIPGRAVCASLLRAYGPSRAAYVKRQYGTILNLIKCLMVFSGTDPWLLEDGHERTSTVHTHDNI